MVTLLLLLSVVTALYVLYWLKKFYDFRQMIDQFPGRPYNCILGDVVNFSTRRDELFLQIREFSKEFPDGFRIWALFWGTINFNSAHDAEFILSSTKNIKKSPLYYFLQPWLQKGLLTSAGQTWQKRRKLLTPAFHFNILIEFVRIFDEHGKNFVKELTKECSQEKTDIVPLLSKLTLNIICETAMGITFNSDDETQIQYLEAMYGFGQLLSSRISKPWIYYPIIYDLTPAGRLERKYIKILHEFTTGVIKERERMFTDDIENIKGDNSIYKKKRFAMLDLLISVKKNNGGISDAGIREEVDAFMFAGHDTTAMGLCFSLLMLANHKNVQERVRAELDDIFQKTDRAATYNDLQNMPYLDMVIKETLRLYPSVPFIGRTVKETTTFHDGKYTIPSGTIVHIHIYDLHRDPRVFADPEKFDPDRFLPENVKGRHPYAYIPFSAGPRNCIGQRFAMLEMKSIISSILRYYELEPVDSPDDVKIMVDLVLRPKNGVHIKFKPRL